MAESIVNKRTQPFGGGVEPSSNATFHDRVNVLCHSELVWQSEQTKNEFCEPASRVAESPTSLVKNKMLNIVDFIKSLFIKRFSMTYLTKTIAFTLAETLVVMGIIGVVAALTIPNLNQSTGDREKVAKVKKIYSNLEDAYGRATATYGPIDTWFVNDNSDEAYSKRFADRMTEFMKVSKNCEDDVEACFASTIKFQGNVVPIDEGFYPAMMSGRNYLLADGTAISFFSMNDFTSAYFYGEDWIAGIGVDIDGKKGSSENGKDVFHFGIYKSGLFPIGATFDNSYKNFPVNDTSFNDIGATAWVIENGNLDYLKCPDDLDWETKTSCK